MAELKPSLFYSKSMSKQNEVKAKAENDASEDRRPVRSCRTRKRDLYSDYYYYQPKKRAVHMTDGGNCYSFLNQ